MVHRRGKGGDAWVVVVYGDLGVISLGLYSLGEVLR